MTIQRLLLMPAQEHGNRERFPLLLRLQFPAFEQFQRLGVFLV